MVAGPCIFHPTAAATPSMSPPRPPPSSPPSTALPPCARRLRTPVYPRFCSSISPVLFGVPHARIARCCDRERAWRGVGGRGISGGLLWLAHTAAAAPAAAQAAAPAIKRRWVPRLSSGLLPPHRSGGSAAGTGGAAGGWGGGDLGALVFGRRGRRRRRRRRLSVAAGCLGGAAGRYPRTTAADPRRRRAVPHAGEAGGIWARIVLVGAGGGGGFGRPIFRPAWAAAAAAGAAVGCLSVPWRSSGALPPYRSGRSAAATGGPAGGWGKGDLGAFFFGRRGRRRRIWAPFFLSARAAVAAAPPPPPLCGFCASMAVDKDVEAPSAECVTCPFVGSRATAHAIAARVVEVPPCASPGPVVHGSQGILRRGPVARG